jgi:Tetratricopeptide repeat
MASYGQSAVFRYAALALGALALFALPAHAFQDPAETETAAPLIEQARLLATEDPDEAEALYLHILELRESSLGADDHSTLMALLELARFYRDSGYRSDAVPLYRRAIFGLSGILDADDEAMRGAERELTNLTIGAAPDPSYDPIVIRSAGPSAEHYPRGTQIDRDSTLTLREGDSITVLTANGTRSFTGPGSFSLEEQEQTRTFAIRNFEWPGNEGSDDTPPPSPPPPPAPSPPPPLMGSLTPPSPARSGIPVYPVWPPESPTWQFSLDRYIGSRDGMSLGTAGSRLQAAFESAGYLEHSYYAVPGGFAIVTRIEQMDSAGNRLRGSARYELPGQRARDSLTNILYSLFVNAPPGYYRYIVVVVSVRPFATRNRLLDDDEALRRLRSGANRLSSVYRRVPFTDDYNVDALIYEFRWDGGDSPVRMLEPGRVSPQDHLTRTGLARAVRSRFR